MENKSTRTYIIRTEIYHKIEVPVVNSKGQTLSHDEMLNETVGAAQTIYDYDLYHINDDGLSQELRMLDCEVSSINYLEEHFLWDRDATTNWLKQQ